MPPLAKTSLALALSLCACATAPGMTYTYKPSAGLVDISVVQSFACDPAGANLAVSTAQPSITVSYRAGSPSDPHLWQLTTEDGSSLIADTDLTVSWWDDGRLKGINSVSTGQGETILKDIVSLATTVAAVAGARPGAARAEVASACRIIKRIGNNGAVSITFAGKFTMDELVAKPTTRQRGPTQTAMEATSASQFVYQALLDVPGTHLGPLKVDLIPAVSAPAVMPVRADNSGYYQLNLQRMQSATLDVFDQQGVNLSKTELLMPTQQALPILIQKPRLFGKSTVVVAVAESGALTSLQYATTSGTPAALNVINAAATASTPPTAADKLAALKAADDLIAENVRHARCLASGSDCS